MLRPVIDPGERRLGEGFWLNLPVIIYLVVLKWRW
jgi:hypothetical protein